MVGDSWENNVFGALGSGMAAVWLNRYRLTCPDPGLAVEIRASGISWRSLGFRQAGVDRCLGRISRVGCEFLFNTNSASIRKSHSTTQFEDPSSRSIVSIR